MTAASKSPPPLQPRTPAPSASRRRRPVAAGPVPLDLALQGGGSHGAFTWGVLDRLLEEEQIEFDGVSGTSAGALNAAVLATGLAEGGRRGAQQALRDFWMDVAGGGTCFGSTAPAAGLANPWPWMAAGWNPMQAWTQQLTQQLTQWLSPYQFNPLDLNPLREVVQRHVRPAALEKGRLALFIIATRVRTGQARVFHRGNLTIDALLASACLPHLFRAVQIEGEPYWDGGYSGNPALWPLIYKTQALDLLLVKIDPLVREGTPDTAQEIADRVNEITFSAPLAGELRAIAFVQKLVQQGRLNEGEYKNLRLHMVADEQRLGTLPSASKMDTGRDFLLKLHGWGRDATEAWLATNRAQLGKASTLDLRHSFLPPADQLD